MLGIEFSDGQTQLDVFSDADFATSDPSRRRVTSGYCFRLWGGPISWQSKRQPSVSLATGDAEYAALAQAAREALWLRSLLTDLQFTPSCSIKLCGDTRHRSLLPTIRSVTTRAKQIDIRFHYLRELVERSVLSIEYVKTTAMLADGLTKSLPPVTFARFVNILGLRSRP
jgi:hypothetical protein